MSLHSIGADKLYFVQESVMKSFAWPNSYNLKHSRCYLLHITQVGLVDATKLIKESASTRLLPTLFVNPQ